MAGSPGRPEPTTTLPVLVLCTQVFNASGGVSTGSSLPPKADSANTDSASGAARQSLVVFKNRLANCFCRGLKRRKSLFKAQTILQRHPKNFNLPKVMFGGGVLRHWASNPIPVRNLHHHGARRQAGHQGFCGSAVFGIQIGVPLVQQVDAGVGPRGNFL